MPEKSILKQSYLLQHLYNAAAIKARQDTAINIYKVKCPCWGELAEHANTVSSDPSGQWVHPSHTADTGIHGAPTASVCPRQHSVSSDPC